NFQHPHRQHSHFFGALDNFFVWVIDLSLKALIVDPDLWQAFEGGDDCLLFRHADLKSPDESVLFGTLLAHDSNDLAVSARRFKELLQLNPHRVPDYQADDRTINLLLHEESLDAIARAERNAYQTSSDAEDEQS